MTIIVEDGTGLSSAETYISVADADTYLGNMGYSTWAAKSNTEKEVALRKAAAYMVQAYRSSWCGYRVTDTQSLDFPREYLPKDRVISGTLYYPNNFIPVEVKRACAELAYKSLTAELLADTTQQVVSESVGAISVTYDTRSPQVPKYRVIEAMLEPFLKGGGIAVEMVRS